MSLDKLKGALVAANVELHTKREVIAKLGGRIDRLVALNKGS